MSNLLFALARLCICSTLYAVMPKRTRKQRQAAEARRLSLESRKRRRVSDEPVVSVTSSSVSSHVDDFEASSRIANAQGSATAVTTSPADNMGADSHTVSNNAVLETTTTASTLPTDSGEGTSSASGADALAGTSTTTNASPNDDVEAAPHTSVQILAQFCEEWVAVLDRDNKRSLAIFLCYCLTTMLSFTETRAAEFVSSVIGKSDRTVRQWRQDLLANDGVLPGTRQGQYRRSGVLWQNEELNKKAVQYVRVNAAVKGKPNMTALSFCKWVNKSLLPNCTLEPGYPRSISVETARTWLHCLGFQVLSPKKGIFIDGHEREDVVHSRKLFLRKMVKVGFIHSANAPTDDAQKALPEDVELPTLERCSKTVVFFHDETTFHSNEDQTMQWGEKGQKMMKQKSRGSGIMVSDFIDEKNGFLALNDEEYTIVKASDPSIRPYAREFLEIGENREGYWTRDKFVAQMERAIQLAEIKYPKASGWRHVWIFDHSSCHAAMADDALDAGKMNVFPGGKQRVMRDTEWDGRVQKMYFVRCGKKVAKGMKMVLEERGVSTVGMKADQMQKVLAGHPDFKGERNMIERLLIGKGHIPCFLPKFHPELNPIERVWAQLKRFTKAHCNYTLPSLRKNIPQAYDTVSLENVQNHFRKVRHYMFCYLEGLTPGKDLDNALKKYKLAVKSHRRIGLNE